MSFSLRVLAVGTATVAFVTLVANPFPGFTGAPGVYPLDLEVDDPRDVLAAQAFFARGTAARHCAYMDSANRQASTQLAQPGSPDGLRVAFLPRLLHAHRV